VERGGPRRTDLLFRLVGAHAGRESGAKRLRHRMREAARHRMREAARHGVCEAARHGVCGADRPDRVSKRQPSDPTRVSGGSGSLAIRKRQRRSTSVHVWRIGINSAHDPPITAVTAADWRFCSHARTRVRPVPPSGRSAADWRFCSHAAGPRGEPAGRTLADPDAARSPIREPVWLTPDRPPGARLRTRRSRRLSRFSDDGPR
jgi:hypothetical protein